MSYQQPPWSGYPPTSPPHGGQQANGHESMLLGSLMGKLEAGQIRTIYVLELIHHRLEENAKIMHERLPHPEQQKEKPKEHDPDRMTWRDWVQIGIAVSVLVAAIGGRVPLKEIVPLLIKPLGL